MASLFVHYADGCDATIVTLEKLLASFESRRRTLIRSADVGESGTIRVNTASGYHLTQKAVLDALNLRDLRRKPVKKKTKSPTSTTVAYRESAADIRRLIELAPARSITRKKLNKNRQTRRQRQLNRMAAKVARQIFF